MEIDAFEIWACSDAREEEGRADNVEKEEEDFYQNFRWPHASSVSHTRPPGSPQGTSFHSFPSAPRPEAPARSDYRLDII